MSLCLGEFRLQFAGVHANEHLARLDQVALAGRDLPDSAGVFRGNVDLYRLDAAVARHDTDGQSRGPLPFPLAPAKEGDGGQRHCHHKKPADRFGAHRCSIHSLKPSSEGRFRD